MEDRVTKEQKLMIAKDLVGSYLRGEGSKNVAPERIGEIFAHVFESIDKALPEAEKRRVGLGLD